MRALPGAFRRLSDRLALVRDRGVPLGLLFTLTMWNAHQIEWAVDYAIANGARLLQVHPLEASGRAVALAGDVPDEFEAAAALQVDIATSSRLGQVAACPNAGRPQRISDIVSPLVVEPDGICVPLEYGFIRDYALGDVRAASLCGLAEQWMRLRRPSFMSGMEAMGKRLAAGDERIIVNSYAMVREVLSGARLNPGRQIRLEFIAASPHIGIKRLP